jgi:hypothetical protein
MKGKKLIVALAVAAIAAPAAAAEPNSGMGLAAGRDAKVSTRPLTSEKTAGLFPTAQPPALASEKTAGMWRKPIRVAAAPVVATPADGFDWSDASIGAGVALGSLLVASAGAAAIRRRGVLVAH